MSFFKKRLEQQKQAENKISHEALFSYDGEKYSYILNKDFMLIKTSGEDGKELASNSLLDLPTNEDVTKFVENFTVEAASDYTNYDFLKFRKNVIDKVLLQKKGIELSEHSLEAKYNLVLKGIQNYIPSSLLQQYDGTSEQKILLFLRDRYPE